MSKKNKLLILCIVLFSSITFTFAASISCIKCPDGHYETVWSNSTGCLTREECNVCSHGYNARHSNASHEYRSSNDVSCQSYVTCYYCGHSSGSKGNDHGDTTTRKISEGTCIAKEEFKVYCYDCSSAVDYYLGSTNPDNHTHIKFMYGDDGSIIPLKCEDCGHLF